MSYLGVPPITSEAHSPENVQKRMEEDRERERRQQQLDDLKRIADSVESQAKSSAAQAEASAAQAKASAAQAEASAAQAKASAVRTNLAIKQSQKPDIKSWIAIFISTFALIVEFMAYHNEIFSFISKLFN